MDINKYLFLMWTTESAWYTDATQKIVGSIAKSFSYVVKKMGSSVPNLIRVFSNVLG